MKANDFRLDNLVYYHIEDSMDERKEWDEVSPIDWDDLRILTEFKDNPEYKLIPLTKEWLLKLGLKYDEISMNWYCRKFYLTYFYEGKLKCLNLLYPTTSIEIKYVHQLQNLYFALTGNELIVKK